jgi:hypothetical protein
MAFLKALPTKYQVNAEYWKVSTVKRSNINPKQVSVSVDGYLNQAARNDPSARPLETRDYTTTVGVFDAFEADNDAERAYLWLKANAPEFADAVDVLEDEPEAPAEPAAEGEPDE